MNKKYVSYSKEQIQWMRDNAYGHTHKELAELFNEEFGTNLTMQQIRRALQKRKILSGMYHKSDMTDEMIEFIYNNCKGITNQELAKRLNEKFGTNYNAKKMQNFKHHRGLKAGIHCCGDVNKRMELMTETIDSRGYTWIKLGEYNWVRKSRYLYEKYIGEIPKDYVIVFKDGNRQNFDLNNLMLADKKMLSQISALMTDDAEINETIILNAKLKIKVRELEDSINEC